MMRRRLTAAGLVLLLPITAACTSSSGHKAKTSPSASSSSASAATLALTAKIQQALSTVVSTAVTIDAGGLIATTTGHIALSDGKATASDFVIGTGSDATHVITVDGVTYAQLPKGQNTSGKPWLVVSATSSNEFARGLDTSVQVLQAASSLGDLINLLKTAGDITTGAPGQYSFDIQGDANGSTLQKQLAELGSAPVPVDLYVNAQNLPVKIVLNIKLGGSTLPITATLGKFNVPVTITRPPSNQIAGN